MSLRESRQVWGDFRVWGAGLFQELVGPGDEIGIFLWRAIHASQLCALSLEDEGWRGGYIEASCEFGLVINIYPGYH